MSFDEIFDLTAGVYFNFYNIPPECNLFFLPDNTTTSSVHGRAGAQTQSDPAGIRIYSDVMYVRMLK